MNHEAKRGWTHHCLIMLRSFHHASIRPTTDCNGRMTPLRRMTPSRFEPLVGHAAAVAQAERLNQGHRPHHIDEVAVLDIVQTLECLPKPPHALHCASDRKPLGGLPPLLYWCLCFFFFCFNTIGRLRFRTVGCVGRRKKCTGIERVSITMPTLSVCRSTTPVRRDTA